MNVLVFQVNVMRFLWSCVVNHYTFAECMYVSEEYA